MTIRTLGMCAGGRAAAASCISSAAGCLALCLGVETLTTETSRAGDWIGLTACCSALGIAAAIDEIATAPATTGRARRRRYLLIVLTGIVVVMWPTISRPG